MACLDLDDIVLERICLSGGLEHVIGLASNFSVHCLLYSLMASMNEGACVMNWFHLVHTKRHLQCIIVFGEKNMQFVYSLTGHTLTLHSETSEVGQRLVSLRGFCIL